MFAAHQLPLAALCCATRPLYPFSSVLPLKEGVSCQERSSINHTLRGMLTAGFTAMH